ncbi:hypothetical protein ABID21_000156 [Pseudorhizobium tarimense]|uniref:Uncharacterized protein n=1 Tax=Pseudorhizobium tarimense TaxID=1079109 RepID=A0ABV2H0T1_9HYPH|nr:hypothetical protein [Pseudorhizobium tarimense]MCJ8517400.1 hypothetical protein [Pseudorhizobium tarimense]
MQMALPVTLLLLMILALGALLMIAPQPVETVDPLTTSTILQREEALSAIP